MRSAIQTRHEDVSATPLLLGELLSRRRADAADRCALIDPPDRARVTDGPAQRLTWREVGERVDRLSLALLDAGVGKGSIVLSPAPTAHETLIVQLAILRLGAICAPVPIQYRAHELSRLMDLVQPVAIVGFARLGKFAHMQMLRELVEQRGQDVALLGYGPDLPDGVTALDPDAARPPDEAELQRLARHDAALQLDPDDTALIVFSSGSEAAPKAVRRSHANQMHQRRFLADIGGLQEGACFMSPRMLNTIGAITTGLVPWLDLGGRMVLHHPFDMEVFLQQIRDERPEMTSCPPAILQMILQRLDAGEAVDLSSLHHITSGSAQLSPSVVHAFRERFGISIVNVYGSSEGALLVSSEADLKAPEDRAAFFPAYGWNGYRSALPCATEVETRLASPESGEIITEPGIPGELCIRSPLVFDSYWNDPARTAAAFDGDGYYHTGDLFEHAGGGRPYYRFVGRLKNMIVRGGMNISAEEVEGLLIDHPKLREVCVVGRPDPKLGEIVAAVVVPKRGQSVTLDELIAYLRDDCHVAVFKLPQHLTVINHMPRSGGGKVDIGALRDLVATDARKEPEKETT